LATRRKKKRPRRQTPALTRRRKKNRPRRQTPALTTRGEKNRPRRQMLALKKKEKTKVRRIPSMTSQKMNQEQ